MVDRSERTVRDWPASRRLAGLCSVVTGYAGDENAAKLTRAQKEQLKETLGGPPSQSGIKADFWDVPALRGVVKILFDVEYQSDSTYQLLLKFCGMSFKLPDPFDKRRDEAAITARMARIRQDIAELLTREGYSGRAFFYAHDTPREWTIIILSPGNDPGHTQNNFLETETKPNSAIQVIRQSAIPDPHPETPRRTPLRQPHPKSKGRHFADHWPQGHSLVR